MDQQLLIALLGIILSVVFFVVSYRNTIGAKKERVRTANREVADALLKCLIQEKIEPTRDELGRVLAGFARDRSLRSRDLYSVPEVLDGLYARVLSNDFIGTEERTRILEKLRSLVQAPTSPELSAQTIQNYVARTEKRRHFPVALGILSAVAGSISAAILNSWLDVGRPVPLGSGDDFIYVIMLFAASSSVLGAYVAFRRRRDAEEDPQFLRAPVSEAEIEMSVARMLDEQGFVVAAYDKGPFDMLFANSHGRYLVDIKKSLRRHSHLKMKDLVVNLSKHVAEAGVDAGFLVSVEPVPAKTRALRAPRLRIVELQEFAEQITHLRPAE